MDSKFYFTHLKSKSFNILTDKEALDYFLKWSLKGQLKLTTFGFNQPFQVYQKDELVWDFFRSPNVQSVLDRLLPFWPINSDMIKDIETEVVPCSVSSMSFFDRILDEKNSIVRYEGCIRHCLDDVIDGFMVADELRKMLIDEESDNFGLFNESDRNELIFRVFRFLVLGGKWCQYEDKIDPYLRLTRILYRDLLRVEKNPETKDIEIKSVCVRIKVMGQNKMAIFPADPQHLQNFVYLIIDPSLRQVTMFAHEFGGQFEVPSQ